MGLLVAPRYAIGIVVVAIIAGLIVLGLIQNWTSRQAQRLPIENDKRRGKAKTVIPAHDRVGDDDLDFAAAVRPVMDPDAAAHSRGAAPRPATPARPAHLTPPRGPAGDPELRAELAKLTDQVATLEERMESGIGGLRRRIEQLETRVDGHAETSTIARDVDALFTSAPPYDPQVGYGGFGDGVVSQPLSFGAGGGELGGGGRIAVELNGTEVSLSSTIPPDAWLTPRGDGKAAVSLDPDVHYHKFALDRFATFFDLGDRREGTYVTRSPAEVRWDEREQRGVLVTSGKAVAR